MQAGISDKNLTAQNILLPQGRPDAEFNAKKLNTQRAARAAIYQVIPCYISTRARLKTSLTHQQTMID